MRSFRAAAAAALSLGSSVYALNTQCVSGGVCYSISIPSSTAQSNTGDVYFQISAPTSYSWAALGQGSGMIGANIFVIYTSSDGTNVTVSPRYATGYSEPQYDTTAQINVLEGSGVSGGKMVANIRCSNCESWSSGSMDFSQSSGNFVYAFLSGSPINSDDQTAQISEHDTKSPFTWDISSAVGGSAGTNPFVAAAAAPSATPSSGSGSGSASNSTSTPTGTGTGSVNIPSTCTPIADYGSPTPLSGSSTLAGASGTGCPTTLPAQFSTGFPTSSPPAWVVSCFSDGYPGGNYHQARATPPPLVPVQKAKRDDGCPPGYESTQSSIGTITNDNSLSGSQQQTIALAHGVLACLAFVALFPTGAILIRIANFSGLLWVHAALQMVSYLVYIVAFGMGIYLATHLDYLHRSHPILGIVLLVILFFQPLFGVLHHKLFSKYGHRTFWSYLHLFAGRIAILLGMVNGGLGIQLADTASTGARIAYAVIVAIVAISYIAVMIIGEVKRKRSGPPTYEKSQKAHQLRDLSSSESDVSRSQLQHQHYEIPPPPPPPTGGQYMGREKF